VLEKEFNRFVHRHLASEVEYSAALARQFGFDIPKEYDLAFKGRTFSNSDGTFELAFILRLNDYPCRFQVKLPTGDDDRTDLTGDLSRCAGELISRWIDRHPECIPQREDSQKVLRFLGSLGDSSDEVMHLAAAKSANGATYVQTDVGEAFTKGRDQ
jgi:hypothetical protein